MIYLIYCSKTKTCKIGYSYNPDNRLKELQTGNPYHLELITTVPGDMSIEKDIHSKFNHLKLKGEWFNYTQEIKDYFKVEDYSQVSSELFNQIFDLNGSEIRVLFYLIELGGIQTLTKDVKTKMAERISIAIGSINNALTVLSEKKLLHRVSTNTYQINPRHAWKGSTKEREFNLKILLENYPDC